MSTRKVTKDQLIKAIEDNGYYQAYGSLLRSTNREILAACAIGQAALNLGVDTLDLENRLRLVGFEYLSLRTRIIRMNDEDHKRPKTIAAYLKG